MTLALGGTTTVPLGCGDDCSDDISASCVPAYDPTFDNVFTNTLQTSCALASCHASESAQGGLAMGTVDQAYEILLGEVDGKVRVIQGDPACSLLTQRVESGDSDIRMPPSGQLPDGERCAIVQWVNNGAHRQ
jgi:hypothetical protein